MTVHDGEVLNTQSTRRSSTAPVPAPVGCALVLAMTVVPAWGNRGPWALSLVDLLLAPLCLWFLVDAFEHGTVNRTPYALPVVLFALAGALSGAFGTQPAASLQAVGTDLYLLVVALSVTRIVIAPGRWARLTALGWVGGAVAWSLPLLLSAAHLIPPSAWGVLVTSSHRAFGTFANPNLAGSYYAVSLFVVLAVVERRSRRLLLAAPMVLALALTGSMAALIGTALGCTALGVRRVVRSLATGGRHRGHTAGGLALASITAVLGIGLGGQAVADATGRIVNNPAFHDSFGRLDRSDGSRFTIWSLGLQQFGDRSLIGVGPAATGPELRAVSSHGKSLHSDVLASLLERGVLGAMALLALAVAVGSSAWSLSRRNVDWLPHPAALGTAALTLAPGLATHEVLHFRHLWLLLGLLAGARLLGTTTTTRS